MRRAFKAACAAVFTAGVTTMVFDEPYSNVLQTFVAMLGDGTAQVDTFTWTAATLSQINLNATIAGAPYTGVLDFTYFAAGQ